MKRGKCKCLAPKHALTETQSDLFIGELECCYDMVIHETAYDVLVLQLIPNPKVTSLFTDTQRPTIDCPGTTMAYAGSGQTTSRVSWDLPTVTDNSNEVLSAEQIEGLPPGADFSRGSHVIKYEVSDSRGNTARCSFSVVVQG